MERPLGLITIWKINKTEPKFEIMKTGLFGHYQNAVDYLNDFAQSRGWKTAPATANTIAYSVGVFRVELSLIHASGVDLTKETYLLLDQESSSVETKES